MFNLFSQKKSVDELIGWNTPENVPNYIQAQDKMIGELIKENKNLNHLKEENVKLIEHIKNLREQQDFLYKDNKNLMKENLELIERVNEIDNDVIRDLKDEIFVLKNEIAMLKAKHQVIQNDYKKCAEQRDEYKHQLNAANKEIEVLKSELRDYQDQYANSFSYTDMKNLQGKLDDAKLVNSFKDKRIEELQKENEILKRWREEQLVVMKQWDEVDQYVRNHKDTKLGEFIAGTCLHFLKQRDEYKAEVEKLKEDIVDYVIEKDDKIQELEKKAETIYVCSRCGYKAAHTYYGICGFCKEGQMMKVYEEQKHPMYPLHWGGIDPDILEQAQEQSIEDVVDVLKGIKTQGFEDYDSQDFEQPTTAENLEKKFDNNVDVLDYFDMSWQCPCNMCKHAREEQQEKSWEEVASDLALKVAKLEKKVEELTIIKNQVQ